MGGYAEWFGTDLYRLLETAIVNGNLKPRSDGKFEFTGGYAWDTPWEYTNTDPANDCLFGEIIFEAVADRMAPGSMGVPLSCQNCWKVVTRPKTLQQLFTIRDIQLELKHPSKVGIETRPSVYGLYGGYWYNHSLREGLERYRQVRGMIDTNLGPDVPLLLKRGCTEMEAKYGDSQKWRPGYGQKEIEQYIRNHIVFPPRSTTPPKENIPHIHRKWVEWAYQNGDETYKEYTDGRPLYTPYRTYHHLVNARSDEIKEFMNAED